MTSDPDHHNVREKSGTVGGLIILLMGLLSTIVVAYYVGSKNEREDELRFNYEISKIIEKFETRIESYEGALIQTRAFLLNSIKTTREEFKGYIRDTEIFSRYPGLQGLGYAEVIPKARLKEHLEEMHKELPDYTVWPMSDRPLYTSIIVLEPEDKRNKRAIGYDMFSEPIRRDAMEGARDTGLPMFTKRISLVQEDEGENLPGFNMYLPFYKKDLNIDSVEARRNALLGYLYSPFRAPEFFKALFSEEKMVLDVEIYEGPKVDPEKFYYDFDGRMSKGEKVSDLQAFRQIDLNGVTFTMIFMPLENFRPAAKIQKPLAVMVMGFIITIFVCWLYYLTRRQMKTARIVAEEQAHLLVREKEHVAARDDFLSITSHELKTPLTSLKLQAQVMMRALDKGDKSPLSEEKVRVLITQIDNQTTRLTRLVDDMLDISRIRTGRLRIDKEVIDLKETVDEVIERLRPQFIRTIGEVPKAEYLDDIKGNWDKFRIEQVLTNIFTNALRYGKGKPIKVVVRKENQLAKIAVIDQGIGIAKENMEKIFNRFERAGMSASEVSGLGLGLFITNQIVKAHGGSIEVESELGKGSVFTIVLPL